MRATAGCEIKGSEISRPLVELYVPKLQGYMSSITDAGPRDKAHDRLVRCDEGHPQRLAGSLVGTVVGEGPRDGRGGIRGGDNRHFPAVVAGPCQPPCCRSLAPCRRGPAASLRRPRPPPPSRWPVGIRATGPAAWSDATGMEPALSPATRQARFPPPAATVAQAVVIHSVEQQAQQQPGTVASAGTNSLPNHWLHSGRHSQGTGRRCHGAATPR